MWGEGGGVFMGRGTDTKKIKKREKKEKKKMGDLLQSLGRVGGFVDGYGGTGEVWGGGWG